MLINNFYKTLTFLSKVIFQKIVKPKTFADNILGIILALAVVFIIIYFYQYAYILLHPDPKMS